MPQEYSARRAVSQEDLSIQRADSRAPSADRQIGQFSEGMLLQENGYLERRATNSLISMGVHLGGIGVLAALSILSPAAMRLSPWTRVRLVVPLPPPKAVLFERRSAPVATKRVLPGAVLTAPVRTMREMLSSPAEPVPQPDGSDSGVLGPVLGNGNVLGGVPNDLPEPVISPVMSETLPVVHQGGDVKSSHPIRELVVAYPEFARMARVVGRVIIQAIIDEKGKVVHARAISGPPLLYLAALDAVSSERFEPVLLNDEPIKCDLKVQVSFKLDDLPY